MIIKKFLLSLLSFSLVISSGLLVVSCKQKEPKEVILEIPTNKRNSIVETYEEMVNDYNAARPNNPIKIKIIQTSLESIVNKIAFNQPLPNLYVKYADTVAEYASRLNAMGKTNLVVDMGEVVNWDPEYLKETYDLPGYEFLKKYAMKKDIYNNKDFYFRPLKNSFIKEGLSTKNVGKMFVIPTSKSLFLGAVNLRLLNEIVQIITDNNLNLSKIEGISNIRESHIFHQDSEILKSLREKYKQEFEEWFRDVETIDDLRELLSDFSKIKILLDIYIELINNSNKMDEFANVFSMGIDDLAAFLQVMQANSNFEPLYSWDIKQPNKIIYTERKNSESLEAMINFLGYFNSVKPVVSSKGQEADHYYGGVGIQLTNSNRYYSSYWQEQKMLFYYGSTAKINFWTRENDSNSKDQFVQTEDVLILPIPFLGNFMNYKQQLSGRQQGAGLAMFNSNISLKNKIAIDFVNYCLEPENNTKLAIAGGYIPVNYFAYYNKLDQNKKIPTEKNWGTYYRNLADLKMADKIKGSKLIKQFVDLLLNDKLGLYVTPINPFGDAIDKQIIRGWFGKKYGIQNNNKVSFDLMTFYSDTRQIWKNIEDQNNIGGATLSVK